MKRSDEFDFSFTRTIGDLTFAMGTCIVASFISPFAGSGESDCLVTERGEQCLVSMRCLNKIHHIAKLLVEENISLQEYGRIKYYFYVLSKLFMDENCTVAAFQI